MRQALMLALLIGCAERTPPALPKPPDPPAKGPFTRRSPHHSTDPALADGWIFLATRAFAPHYDIYRKKPDGETVTVVAASEGDERFPAPRGKELAFCSTIEGFVGVYLIPDFTAPPPPAQWPEFRISPPNMHAIHPSWSPRGDAIVYCATHGKDWSQAQLVVYEVAGEATHMLGITGLLPEWSPNDDRIVYQKMRGRDGFLGGIWVVRLNGVEPQEETRVFDMPEFASINPTWSPQADRILFAITRPTDDPMAPQRARDLGIVPADGSQFWHITEDAEPDWLPVWSADGLIYFVSERDGPQAIWTTTSP
jgi:Tol biopolymer transport system component